MQDLKLRGYKWQKATHYAGWFVHWAKVSKARAIKLAQDYLETKPPICGYEITLYKNDKNSLNLVNVSGKYELRIV